MKCPKCGSPRTGRDSALKRRCKNCNINIEQYQARLDKVLSKFEVDGDDMYYKNGDIYIRYCIYRKKFGIGIFKKRIISLDTVESLIKDLEGNQ